MELKTPAWPRSSSQSNAVQSLPKGRPSPRLTNLFQDCEGKMTVVVGLRLFASQFFKQLSSIFRPILKQQLSLFPSPNMSPSVFSLFFSLSTTAFLSTTQHAQSNHFFFISHSMHACLSFLFPFRLSNSAPPNTFFNGACGWWLVFLSTIVLHFGLPFSFLNPQSLYPISFLSICQFCLFFIV